MNYKKISLALGIIVAFLAGCVVHETFHAALAVPPARAGTNLVRWEYLCLESTSAITANANRLGAEGWELAAASGAGWGQGLAADHTMVWCFKRPLG